MKKSESEKPYLIVYVQVYFPYPFITVVKCNLDLLGVVFVVVYLNAFDFVWRIELFKVNYLTYFMDPLQLVHSLLRSSMTPV